ncbi:uncharacterized protein LOC141638146 [Silene latifolia]|uniref:uncharacterized protein LOC141638146 n=1 Tax=Silene latifolia TaxID=37657 RepID=UPI003D770D23
MDAFRETMDVCGFHDLGFRGNKFTWQMGLHMRTFVREKLDRVIVTEEWGLFFPRTAVSTYSLYVSDDAAFLLDEGRGGRVGHRGFKFEPFWAADEGYGSVVKEAWDKEGIGGVAEKVQRVAGELKSWAKVQFGDAKRRLKEKEDELGRW